MLLSSLPLHRSFLSDQPLLTDLETLRHLFTVRGDDLAVVNRALQITEGGFLQSPSRTFNNLFYGGYNSHDVTAYLESLAERSWSPFKNLETLINDGTPNENYYINLESDKKRFAEVATKISDLGGRYRGIAPRAINDRVGQVFESFRNLSIYLKKFLKQYPVSIPLELEPLDLTTPARLRPVFHKMPKGMTPQDVVTIVRSLQAQTTSDVNNIGVRAVTIVGIAAGSVIAGPPTLLKWIVWNPIELIRTGHIETKNPISWLADNMNNFCASNAICKEDLPLEPYALSLLHVQYPTEEHIDAFCQLAPDIRFDIANKMGFFIGYEIISSDANELLSILSYGSENSKYSDVDVNLIGPKAIEALSQLIQETPKKSVTIGEFNLYIMRNYKYLRWIDDPDFEEKLPHKGLEEYKQSFVGSSADDRKMHFLGKCEVIEEGTRYKKESYVKTNQVLRVIDAVAANSTCTDFRLSGIYEVKSLHDRLVHHGFVKQSNSPPRYKRSIPEKS